MKLFTYCAAMAIVTYLIRMLPLTLIHKKIQNRFLKSFLYYIPYAVLAAMVIPDIFFATGTIYSAVIGFIVAVVLSLKGFKLITTAIASCISVFLVNLLLSMTSL